MSLSRNKQMLLMAVAAAAFICGSDFALAQQRPEGGAQGGARVQSQGGARAQGGEQGGARVQGQGGARVQGGEQGGARQSGPGAAQREQRSNMRGAQGPERRELTPGQRGSNAREAQGPERSRGTTGQNNERLQERSRTSREQRGRPEGSTTGQSERRFEGNNRSNQRFEERGNRSTTVGRSERTNVELNDQQRSRIRTVVTSHRNIPRLSSANFDVRVGGVVPRSVRFVAVPEDIWRIYPRWRRDRIVIVGDEILIIDPYTYEIIAVLPA
jgi:Protein of unknown function (DUF1236)